METSYFSVCNGLEQLRDVILVGLFGRFVSWSSLRLLWVRRCCRLGLSFLILSPLVGRATAGAGTSFGHVTALLLVRSTVLS